MIFSASSNTLPTIVLSLALPLSAAVLMPGPAHGGTRAAAPSDAPTPDAGLPGETATSFCRGIRNGRISICIPPRRDTPDVLSNTIRGAVIWSMARNSMGFCEQRFTELSRICAARQSR